MALDSSGNKGVSRAPMPGPNAPECVICTDSGLYKYDGTFRVCMSPHTEGKREDLQKQAEEANDAMARMESRIGKR